MYGYLNLQKAAETYPRRREVHDTKFKVQFGAGQSSIQLDIPRGGKLTPEGWNIKPSHPPRVSLHIKFANACIDRWWIFNDID